MRKKKGDYTLHLIVILFAMAGINVGLKITGWSFGLLDFLVGVLAVFWVMIMVYITNRFKFKNQVTMMVLGFSALILAVTATISYIWIPITDVFMQNVFSGLLPLVVGIIVGIIITIVIGICERRM